MYIGDIFVSEKNYALVGVEFTFTVLACTCVILRIFTRLWLSTSIGFDDGFIVLSMVGRPRTQFLPSWSLTSS